MAAKKASRKAPPKSRRALAVEAAAERVMPLDYMLEVLNAPRPVRQPKEPQESFLERLDVWEARRMDAAKAAAPYIHAKPQASVKIESVEPIEERPVNVLELAKRVAFLFTLAQTRPEVDVTPRNLN